MSKKSYTLSGKWTLIKEEKRPHETFPYAIPDLPAYDITIPFQYGQGKWKLDYAYSAVVSRYHGYVWYYRSFEAMPQLPAGERYRLEFDRVSYVCEVFLNGTPVGTHRHSEEPFSFDVTDAVKHMGENLLAVRCFEPVSSCEAIDGIRLDLIPNGFWAGSEENQLSYPIDSAGGILEDVRLTVVPDVRIEDVYVRADPHTGEVYVELTFENAADSPEELKFDVRFSDQRRSRTLTSAEGSVTAAPGKTVASVRAAIPHHKLWELENPVLYLAEVRTDRDEARIVRFGFKEFLLKSGYFFLNGKRIFLKCAHGMMNAQTVIGMKAVGFNAFRSLQQVMPSEILDLCDEMGILIIESPLTAWGMRYHENTKSMIESSMRNLVRLHRNHVCMGAYYIFNELGNIKTFHIGRDCLPMLRDLAPDAVFLLSSGRWEREYETGSASNPGSYEWDCCLGNEGKADPNEHPYPGRFYANRNIGMGDLHPYVYIPMDAASRNWFRTAGDDSRPIFITECGIGTQEHAERTYFSKLTSGRPADCETVTEARRIMDDMENFLTYYGMEDVYPFAEDICREADALNGRQRLLLFDLIRSNPKINGFSLTSWGGGSEGTLEGDNVIKRSVAYAMQDGWAPLRWALFTEERVLYANRPFRIEAVLCNEDALAPGKYRGRARIKGADGIVWKRDFTAEYPEKGYGDMPPLAATVLSETVSLPAGSYTFNVRLSEGGCPYGGELRFDVMEPTAENLPAKAAGWGLAEDTKAFLERYGTKISEDLSKTPKTVFIGVPENADDEKSWEELLSRIKSGTTAVFLNPALFFKPKALSFFRSIAGEKAACSPVVDWLYHFDSVHIRHPLFGGIHDEGMIDLEAFVELFPRLVFTGTEKADKTICASLRVDGGSCTSSLTIGEYRVGDGKVVFNDFRIEETLNKNPVADQMLLNFVTYYSPSTDGR